MCGIVGVTSENDLSFLNKMRDLMYYRGPDDAGSYFDRNNHLGIAMRRLAILDLDHGHQPMTDNSRQIWIVFNGEIFNAPELRADLVADDIKFETINSDTEVLIYMYKKHGRQMLRYLNGMFAFAIYDKNRNLLFGARDRMGIKPLYYSHRNGNFAFASEMKCLRLLNWIGEELNTQSFIHFLSLQYVPAPETILRDVMKLKAGHSFEYNLKSKTLKIDKYWELPVEEKNENFDKKKAIEIVRNQIEAATLRWTLSDVPVACSLSGGLDSSYLISVIRKHGFDDLQTYSLGFESEECHPYDETILAEQVSNMFNTEHHTIRIKPEDILESLPKMVWHLDEPYAGGLPSWFIYQEIRKNGIKVVLTGTGGDELFGNYGKWIPFERSILYRYGKSMKRSLKDRTFNSPFNFIKNGAGHFIHNYLSDAFKQKIIDERLFELESTEHYLSKLWDHAPSDNVRNKIAWIDFQMQLPEEFLAMTDRFSMAHSVEARVPFLDHLLVEQVYKIPATLRTTKIDVKYLIRELAKEVLPPSIINAKKSGFILPLTEWTRGKLKNTIKDLIEDKLIVNTGLFKYKSLTKMLDRHFSGVSDYTQNVWTIFMFALWILTVKRS